MTERPLPDSIHRPSNAPAAPQAHPTSPPSRGRRGWGERRWVRLVERRHRIYEAARDHHPERRRVQIWL